MRLRTIAAAGCLFVAACAILPPQRGQRIGFRFAIMSL